MKELNRTDRLTIAAILFAVILIIGFLTIRKHDVQYTRSIDETLDMLVRSDEIITTGEFSSIADNTEGKYLLVDVRNPVEYQKSHFDHAMNIPLHDILQKENLNGVFKKTNGSLTIVLYGADQAEANQARIMLKQVGVDNVKVLQGGYQIYMNDLKEVQSAGMNPEVPKYNYKEAMNRFGTNEQSTESKAPETLKVTKKAKKSTAEGGC